MSRRVVKLELESAIKKAPEIRGRREWQFVEIELMSYS